MAKLSATEIKEQKKETVTTFLTAITSNSYIDRFGNVKFTIDGTEYRYKIKQNVVRFERKVESLKEWRLVKSHNLNKVYQKAINIDNEGQSK